MIIGLFICSCDFNANTSLAPKAVKGVLDLSNWDFHRDGPITLSGEYAFYWNQLNNPQDYSSGSVPPKTGFIDVPGFWHKFTADKIRTEADGYATYHLKILFNPNHMSDSLAIKYMDIGTRFSAEITQVSSSIICACIYQDRVASCGVAGSGAEIGVGPAAAHLQDLCINISCQSQNKQND